MHVDNMDGLSCGEIWTLEKTSSHLGLLQTFTRTKYTDIYMCIYRTFFLMIYSLEHNYDDIVSLQFYHSLVNSSLWRLKAKKTIKDFSLTFIKITAWLEIFC